jgi:hypothetical protein
MNFNISDDDDNKYILWLNELCFKYKEEKKNKRIEDNNNNVDKTN